MTDVKPVSTPPRIVDRAKAIILTPKTEWPVIDAEPATIGGIFTGYVLLLAAIPPIAGFLGGQIFGFGAFGFSYRPSLVGGIALALTQYVMSLAGTFLLAVIINFLAPNFGGQRDKLKAMKVAAYSGTAGWLAGIFSLLPPISFLGLVGLYSLYLLYLGLPRLMRAPQDKAIVYTIVTIVAGALLFLIAGLVTAPITRYATFGGAEAVSGEMTVPGVGKVDLDKLDAASKQMEAAAAKMEEAAKTGKSTAIPPATLQAMLPERVGRFTRTEVESSGMSAGANARGTYSAGSDTLTLQVTDLSVAGAFAGLGAALNVQSNKQTATGYEKTETKDGSIVNEEWDNESHRGKYGMTIANRFMVEAEGTVGNIDELKGAVAALGPEKLAALAK